MLKELREEVGVLAMAQMEVLVASGPGAIDEMEVAKSVRELVLTGGDGGGNGGGSDGEDCGGGTAEVGVAGVGTEGADAGRDGKGFARSVESSIRLRLLCDDGVAMGLGVWRWRFFETHHSTRLLGSDGSRELMDG